MGKRPMGRFCTCWGTGEKGLHGECDNYTIPAIASTQGEDKLSCLWIIRLSLARIIACVVGYEILR
jgi:hypothetical protein